MGSESGALAPSMRDRIQNRSSQENDTVEELGAAQK